MENPKDYTLKSNQDTVATYPGIYRPMPKRMYLAYLRMIQAASTNVSHLSPYAARLACGKYDFNGGEAERLKDMHKLNRLYRDKKLKHPGAAEAYYAFVDELRDSGKMASIKSTKRVIGYLKAQGLVKEANNQNRGMYYIVPQRKVVRAQGLDDARISINAKLIYNSFPNGKTIEFNAALTEATVEYTRNGIRIANKGNGVVDRDGVRSKSGVEVKKGTLKRSEASNVADRVEARVHSLEISTLAGAAKFGKVCKSTAWKHRRLQKSSVYDSGGYVKLNPGVGAVNVRGHWFNVEIPHTRHEQLMLADEMNRMDYFGAYGRVIPFDGGIAVRESSLLVHTDVKVKKGPEFYFRKSKESGVPFRSKNRKTIAHLSLV